MRSARNSRASIAVSLLALVVLALSLARAFNSYPVGTEHDAITAAAAGAKGFTKKAIAALQQAVRLPDWDESERKNLWSLQYVPNARYDPSHHFDRIPGVSSKDAFLRGARYLRAEKQDTIDKAKAGNPAEALKALGRALHAVQDFKSHSNYIDLTDEERKQVEAALWDDTKQPPATLKITGFDPKAADPERPKGDNYSHAEFSKDFPTKNDESKTKVGDKTKFDLAKEAAIRESQDLLQMVMGALTEAQWKSLAGEEERDDSAYQFKCENLCAPDRLCFLSCGGATISLPAGALPQSGPVSLLGPPPEAFWTVDQTVSSGGAWMGPVWELRADVASFLTPGTATVTFNKSKAGAVVPSTFRVYLWDAGMRDWLLVPGGSVNPSAGTAMFPVVRPGTYAVGGSLLKCRVNGDAVVDVNDINLIFQTRNTPALPGDPRDADGDRVITANDARICVAQCAKAGCAP